MSTRSSVTIKFRSDVLRFHKEISIISDIICMERFCRTARMGVGYLKESKGHIKIVPVVLGVLLIGSLCVNGYIYSQIVKVNGTIEDTQGSLVGITSELASINSEIANKQEKLDLLQREKEAQQLEESKPDTVNESKAVSEPAQTEGKEEQPIQKTPKEKTPSVSSNKGGRDVDGDGTIDFDSNGDVIPWSSLDKNGNGIVDTREGNIVTDGSGSAGYQSDDYDYELDTH